MAEETKRVYPDGTELTKAERNLAWGNTHVDSDGGKMRRGFSSKMTCTRGPRCSYSRELAKSNGLRWAVYAELLRLGCHRMARRAVDVKDIDGRVKQLRETNAKEKGVNWRKRTHREAE